ncbi:MAG: catechol 2,3-dioxygenase [Gammaproteobacteria bacterium]|jgi:catechol 2,3-dioxygenase|nr:catechol 2,3-dioxygenase [Gammaproteobacteria bacterium]
MSFKGVMRPGHAAIRVLDMQESVKYYVERIGLIKTDEDDQGRVYLKAWDEHDRFSIVLREADSPGIDHMAFKVYSTADLDEFEGKLNDYGQNVERIPANELKGCGERVRFDSPSGHTFELYAEKEVLGNGLGRKNPDPWPEGLKGMQVYRFDHCLLYGSNSKGTVDIFREVLGFDLTEEVVSPEGDRIAAFLSCSNKAHDLAILEYAEPGKLHHVSFMLMSWEEVLRAADIMGMHNISIDIGPTRHGITRGRTIYFFDPSGNRNEVFCGDYTWYPDHGPITWNAEELGKAIFYHDRKLNENFLTVVT